MTGIEGKQLFQVCLEEMEAQGQVTGWVPRCRMWAVTQQSLIPPVQLHFVGNSRWSSVSSLKKEVIGHEETSSLGKFSWILGKPSSLKGQSGIGRGCPGK